MHKRLLLFLFLLQFTLTYAATKDSIIGKWRGTIIGHVDNKDYFINAIIDTISKSEYTIQLKVFSGDYVGEFILNTTLKNQYKLFINSFIKKSEFPYAVPHISDCFTGYFQLKKDATTQYMLDLYRNPIMRKMEDFTLIDTAGNFTPSFECFTTVELFPTEKDTMYAKLERKTDSIITAKKNTKEVAKRKLVSSKEWSVKQESITLQIWDNNKEDGDIISLKFNDTWILTNFQLKKEKYTIPIKLTQKDNQLLLFAENLGSIPPNTAAVSIDDNDLIRTFILNSDMSKSETVKIILAKPGK